MPTLKNDVFSHAKKGFKYGSKGETVKVISDRGNVLIVENSKKQRFPINNEKLA